MGVDPVTLSMIVAGAGSAANTVGNIYQNRQAGRRADRLENLALSQMEGPGFLESILRSQYNVGQDGQMQMFRLPNQDTLDELAQTGSPFDTSELFAALQPVRSRQLNEGLASLRAGAPGLGQRFGSAMMRGEQMTVLEHLQNIAAQDAGINFQAHEAAQGRRLGAAQVGAGAQLGVMQLLASLEQGRRGGNLNALSIAAGIPQAAPVSYGQPGFDMGQLLLLRQLTQTPNTASSWTPPTVQPWRAPQFFPGR